MNSDLSTIYRFFEKNGRYSPEAYHFVLLCLRHIMKKLPAPRHVSGRELLDAVREYGLKEYGFLAPKVLEFWGVRETMDIGRIVFDLVEMNILRKTQEDSLEDFRSVYEFQEVFRNGFIQSLEKF
ncbi:MAG: hypothetical protein HY586_04935 [Candidatus Omnitrophica bacterium]|nr:hypothetical protein [Candidatus Omnitrophota bacterium]